MLFDGKDRAVARILAMAFPGEIVREVHVEAREKVSFFGRHWSEGCRNTYACVKLDGSSCVRVPECSAFHKPDGLEGDVKMEPGIAVVCRHECRKTYWTITVHPDSMPKSLPATVDLADDERIVLVATRSLKSSYGGISNYRFHEAKSVTGITQARWDAAKASLIARKLLNAAGAITMDGKNAAGTTSLRELRPAPAPALVG